MNGSTNGHGAKQSMKYIDLAGLLDEQDKKDAGLETRHEFTKKIISKISKQHVFWLMMILPNHTIHKS